MKIGRVVVANVTVGVVLCMALVIYLGFKMQSVRQGTIAIDFLGVNVAKSTRIPLAEGGSSVPLSFGPGLGLILALPNIVLTPIVLALGRRRRSVSTGEAEYNGTPA